MLVIAAVLFSKCSNNNGQNHTHETPSSVWSFQNKTDFAIPEGGKFATVYYSPTCGCCKDWMHHLEEHGFILDKKSIENTEEMKNRLGVPGNMRSCHTAIIGGYLVEGHVPARDIVKILKEKPAIAGISVPEMPVGPPGMEGSRKDPFSVIAFEKNGKIAIYSKYDRY